MSGMDIYTGGAARVVDADGNNILPVVRAQLQIDPAVDDAEDYGEIPLMPCLGITSLPVVPDATGKFEMVCASGVGGYNAVCIGGHDSRCVDVVGQLRPGETAIHNTGGDATKRSRAFFKENCASIIVGNDLVLMLDRKNSKITITGFGHIFEMSAAQGMTMMTKGGKSCIHLMENGTIDIMASTINLGGALSAATPATAVLCGVTGLAGIPSTAVGCGVYVRP